MDEHAKRLEQLRQELRELQRQRSMFQNNPYMSSAARQEAVRKIDIDIEAKAQEIEHLRSD